jgi:glutaredoxin
MTVVVYTKPGCPSCDSVKSYLRGRNITFDEMVVGQDITREELLERMPGIQTVPQVIIDGHVVGGYESTRQFLTEG